MVQTTGGQMTFAGRALPGASSFSLLSDFAAAFPFFLRVRRRCCARVSVFYI